MKNIQVLLISFLISIATILSYSTESNKTLLIFGAKWCGYCTKAKNDIETNAKLSDTIKTYKVINIDYDIDKDAVEIHNIKTLPTFIIFQDGKEVKRSTGYSGPDKLTEFLK